MTANAPSPSGLVEQLVAHGVLIAHADRGTVARLEADELVVEACFDTTGPAALIGSRWKTANQPHLVEAIQQRRLVVATEVGTAGRAPDLAGRRAEFRHLLAAPLLVGGEIEGLVLLSRFREPGFSESDIESAQQLAPIMAVAVRDSRLLREERARRAAAEATANRVSASEGQLAEAERIAGLGSWYWDIPNDTVGWSEELYRLYGRNPAEGSLTYEGYLAAVHPDDREFVRSRIGDAFQTGSSFSFEHRIVRQDGTIRTHQSLGRVELDETGRPARMAGTAQDITERKQAEAQLLALTSERQAQLREHAERIGALENLKSEFLLLASHELRGPLTVLKGYISMMQDGTFGELPEGVRNALPNLVGKGAEMQRLIDEMLLTAQLEQDLQLDFKPIDLGAVVTETTRGVELQSHPEHRLVVTVPAPALVLGDIGRLVMVISILLDNAIKYSVAGGEVNCSLSTEEGFGIVEVRDEGMGISAEGQARLFTRFGRIVTPDNASIPGTGLGLYLAQRVARMHGGEITVESQLGTGSTFRLRLPLATDSGDSTRAEAIVESAGEARS